jgi:hypothetical protein
MLVMEQGSKKLAVAFRAGGGGSKHFITPKAIFRLISAFTCMNADTRKCSSTFPSSWLPITNHVPNSNKH